MRNALALVSYKSKINIRGLLSQAVDAQKHTLVLALAISWTTCFLLFTATELQAQQRAIINTSFEQVTPQFSSGQQIVPETAVTGWLSSNGTIEVWHNGFLNVPSVSGNYFVELNPVVPVELYQEICLVNGEQLRWTFNHAARYGGEPQQTIEFNVTQTSDGALVQNLDGSSLPAPGRRQPTVWSRVTGQTNAAGFVGTTGLYRVGFRSTNAGSRGNFLDDITLSLAARAEFENIHTSFAENTAGTLPRIRVSGDVGADVTIPINISGGSATAGSDFTPVGPANIFIPAGTYDGTSQNSFFEVPYSVVADVNVESDETIIFSIGTPSSGDVVIAAATCGAAAMTQISHTIENDDTVQVIDAIDDTPATVDGAAGAVIANIVANDTLGGVLNPGIGSRVTITVAATAQDGSALGLTAPPAAGAITLDPATGEITVTPSTSTGTYFYLYEICALASPTNCDTATVIIEVTPVELISSIEDDLKDVLEEDLLSTLRMQSDQISGYSGDALEQLRNRQSCLSAVNARLAQQRILFDKDSALILPQSKRLIDDIAATLRTCPGSAIEIAGHTDSDASDAYNLHLSQRRVEAILRALVLRGVDITHYVVKGYGERKPIASNATAAGKAKNRRVEFRALESETAFFDTCENRNMLARTLNGHANDKSTNLDGRFFQETNDCARDIREVLEGTLTYSNSGQNQKQTAVNLSYRREHYRGVKSVFGYFVGMYASSSEVARIANGEITGLGVNAGIYGANRLNEKLYLDYYLGAATGRHQFDLSFGRDIGVISASGNYSYFAGFAGAALSGSVELNDTTLTPRVGFDYIYTPGADVEVLARFGRFSEIGSIELDPISGGRAFAEIRIDHPIWQRTTNLWVNPRISCYQSLGSLAASCGYGGAFGIESAKYADDLKYTFEVRGEWVDGRSSGLLGLSVSRDLGVGVFSFDAGLGSDGAVNVAANLSAAF